MNCGFLLAFLPLLSCTSLVESDRVQCSETLDCASRGGEFAGSVCVENFCKPDPVWSCLGTKRAAAGAGPFRVTVPGAADVVTQQPILGATISLCRKLDVSCVNPVETLTADTAQGVSFSLELGFTGYLQANMAGYLSSLYFFNPAVDRDQTTAAIPLATQGSYTALMAILGVVPDGSRGTAVLLAYDCTGKTATGISFSSPNSDGLSKSFYYSKGLPSTLATTTDAFGYGGMANLPAGSATVAAHLDSPSADLPTVSLIVRPLSLSFAQVVPYTD